MKGIKNLIISLLCILSIPTYAQLPSGRYWQQQVAYTMDIEMNVETHQYTGEQKLVYYNNSDDTLDKVYYHLYFNAFQPGSMMDVRSRTIADPDKRVGDRISRLKPNEIGYQHIVSLKQDGKALSYKVTGTLLEVVLNKPIKPNTSTTFEMVFNAQVPVQIRRSGRDNAEGIAYSMAQWYPKMCEYDYRGWHTTPYVGREFHGVWGDFEVNITIDPTYVIGGTGVLQNPDEIGHGYSKKEVKHTNNKPITWHFKAEKVHDFVWGADPDYKHTTIDVPDNGPTLHFFYEETPATKREWEQLPVIMSAAMKYVSDHYGKYPYKQYSFVQGGDGGMEYAMATLIKSPSVGTAVHEMVHSWYHGVLATNESLYPWMDEGFTSYVDSEVMTYLSKGDPTKSHIGSLVNYLEMAASGNEEPLTTHADHYHYNRSYSINAYSKGAVFLLQLQYIVGKDAFQKGMLTYYDTWKFKHPTPITFIRVMEQVSGIHLDWYLNTFMNTTKQIDYGVRSVLGDGEATYITLERIQDIMMPIDLYVTYKDGSRELIYIPVRSMMGEKPVEDTGLARITKEAWPWTYPTYTLKLNRKVAEISKVEIDETIRMADIDRSNNSFDVTEHMKVYEDTTQ